MLKLQTPGGIAAVVEIPAGRMSILAADRAPRPPPRYAHAGKDRDVTAAEQTTVEFGNGLLRVIAPAATNQMLSSPGSIGVTLQLPAGSRVETTSAPPPPPRGVHRGPARRRGGSWRSSTHSDRRCGVPAEISTARGGTIIGEAVRGTVVLRTQHGDISSPPPAPPPRWTPTPARPRQQRPEEQRFPSY
ncbi:hypothetical protein [Streptomyces sp. NPDC056544]|uniref:hypothetical protein n=1 Tax=unclassified Streptomyces TaxID=2593676 RepID=UPI0036990904